MDRTKPLKRSKYLVDISRDHHHGLLFCWKIREGFKNDIAVTRIKQYADWFWQVHLIDHFKIEEHYIFPILGNEHELVKRALSEHRRLTRLFDEEEDIWRSLNQIEEELDNHIRFEERTLFNEIQRVATDDQLKTAAQHHQDTAVVDTWGDKFWE